MGNKGGSLAGRGKRRSAHPDESKQLEKEDLDAVVTIPFFGSLENERLQLIQDLFSRRSYKKGEIVIGTPEEQSDDTQVLKVSFLIFQSILYCYLFLVCTPTYQDIIHNSNYRCHFRTFFYCKLSSLLLGVDKKIV